MLGTPLSDVPVHRGPSSAIAASAIGARAYTAGAEVHLPAALGATSHGAARETLAHELTHVAQQRRLGAVAPVEDSPAGAGMEDEARSVARRVSVPQRVEVAPPAIRRPAVALSHVAAARTSLPSPAASTSSLSPSDQRAMAHHIESSALSSGVATRLPGGGVAFGGSAPANSTIGVQREPERSDLPDNQTSHGTGPVAEPAPSSPLDDLTPERVAELASRLYDGIRARLRHDLLVQRERAGALFDHR